METKLSLGLIAGIVLNGIELWSDARKAKFQKKHFAILEELRVAKSATPPDYTDAAIAVAERKYENFLIAYDIEQQQEVAEKGGAGE